MASTLTSILLHITFSTKNRAALINSELEHDLYDYIGGICRRMDSPIQSIGGRPDHVHIFLSLSKTIALSDLMMELKRDSSKMMKHKVPLFAWQDGYFAFSIGESGRHQLVEYIANQKMHHAELDFKAEVREFSRRYGLELIEEHAWT